jgi:hypothetical protein
LYCFFVSFRILKVSGGGGEKRAAAASSRQCDAC